ncbi:T9SS type A sorting domain-containing protein [Mesonia aestuariivivens]|uniref:T9SS type A sorting domain-containing protein n=1 Tax=Mesonia aestuariivivens TaxID=2796128 RepID=A0ABS6VYZ2_9FLAO|nr:T9SS type A sorting domain-containing protein [Mesonia aestuariivivens]MBW2960826.1 T9SS type A sorting domain-containing protein [Mesonia aestuariivivens]
MKTIIKLIICMLSFNSFAQVAPLEDHTWYLEKIIINNADFLVPSEFENNYNADFSNSADYLLSAPCYPIEGTLIYSQNQTFNINDAGTPLDCDGLPQYVVEYDDFFFHELILSINTISNPFSYTFTTQPNYIVLTITNANGDQAIYRNQQLAVRGKKKVAFSLYPNPTANSFQVEMSSGEKIKSIRVFSVNGKEVLRFKESQTNYDVSQLSKGVYFVKIESEIGQSLKKIVKK